MEGRRFVHVVVAVAVAVEGPAVVAAAVPVDREVPPPKCCLISCEFVL